MNAVETLRAFPTFLEADPDDVVLALSFAPLSDGARFALERSASKLGFGEERIAYVTVTDDAGHTLEPDDLWQIIEGIDPLCVIITDDAARGLTEIAYGRPITVETVCTVADRRTVAFRDIDAMLSSDDGKQHVWHALKSLPR